MVAVKSFVRANKLNFSILLFVALFSLLHYFKPAIVYTPEGGFRQFGVGYKQKTVLPIWLLAIFMAILSYIAVMYYLMSS
jgi:hypothetical protein